MGECEHASPDQIGQIRMDRPELRAISNQVGSFFPQRENFRLTPEGKAKFTERSGLPSLGFLNKRIVVKNLPRIGRFSRSEGGLRAMAERVPQAEAMAASWIEIVRPTALRIYGLRRRIATIAVALLAATLFVHVMFGANGMVIYRSKRAERLKLQAEIQKLQKENDLYTQRIRGLQADPKAIEKEAREQLHYARPGEVVYVEPSPVRPATNAARK